MWCIPEVIAGWIDIYDLGLYSGKVHGEGMWWIFGLYKSSILHRIFDTKRLFVGTKIIRIKILKYYEKCTFWGKVPLGTEFVPWSWLMAHQLCHEAASWQPWGRFMAAFWCHEAGSWHIFGAMKLVHGTKSLPSSGSLQIGLPRGSSWHILSNFEFAKINV